MTNPEPGGPSQPGRRDWMLSGVATVMLLVTLRAVTGNFWWGATRLGVGRSHHPPTPPRWPLSRRGV